MIWICLHSFCWTSVAPTWYLQSSSRPSPLSTTGLASWSPLFSSPCFMLFWDWNSFFNLSSSNLPSSRFPGNYIRTTQICCGGEWHRVPHCILHDLHHRTQVIFHSTFLNGSDIFGALGWLGPSYHGVLPFWPGCLILTLLSTCRWLFDGIWL